MPATAPSWRGEDGDRPLSDRGLGQAKELVDLLGDRGIGGSASSPARRCVQTVEPLAEDARSLSVDLDKRLAEGAAVRGALDLMLDGGDDQVLCAHGDLIPGLMHRLVGPGACGPPEPGPVPEGVGVGDRAGPRPARQGPLPPALRLTRPRSGAPGRRGAQPVVVVDPDAIWACICALN